MAHPYQRDIDFINSLPTTWTPKSERAKEQGKAAGAKGLFKILEILDLPRAGIVSAGKEVADLIGGGGKFSAKDFVEQTKRHIGVGEFLADADLPGGINTKRALGFLGDVALDPLTYLAPEAKLAHATSESVARKLVTEGAEKLGREAAEDAATRVMRSGVSALTEEELGAIGARGGLHINVPGTGRLARTVTGRAEPKQLQLLGHETVSKLGRTIDPARQALRESAPVRAITERVGTDAALRRAARSGEAGRAIPALKALDVSRLARGKAHQLEGVWLGDLQKLLGPWYKTRKTKQLVQLLEEPDPVMEAALATRGLDVDAIRSWLSKVRGEANEAAGEDFIAELPDYFPHQLRAEARSIVKKGGRGSGFRKASPEFLRTIRAEGKFLGRELESGSIAELDRIGREVLGDSYNALFETDPVKVLPAYAKLVARRVSERRIESELAQEGIVKLDQATAAVTDAGVSQRATEAAQKALVDAEPFARSADPGDRLVGALKYQSQLAEDVVAHRGIKPLTVDELPKQLGRKGMPEAAAELFQDGLGSSAWKEFAAGKSAPEDVADFLMKSSKMTTAEGWNGFLRFYDKLLGLWKGYATLSPGFSARNILGGSINMFIDGVDLRSARRFVKAWKGKGASAADRELVEQIINAGIISGGQVAHEIERAVAGAGKFNPVSQGNVLLQTNRKVAETAENLMRGTHAFDVLAKGGTIEDAVERVGRIHFDYNNLSDFERRVAKRIVPFYTWTSRNLPLQLELMLRNPAAFKKYVDLKRNVEMGSHDDNAVPGYYSELGAIRLPFGIGGDQAYLTLDTPLTQASNLVDSIDQPTELLQDVATSTSPFIKTPLELWSGKSFFKNLPIERRRMPVPLPFKFLVPVLAAVGKAHRTESGDWEMDETDAYAVEQFLPLLGRMRRLVPNEPRYQKRVTSSWLSFLFGIGTRVNQSEAA